MRVGKGIAFIALFLIVGVVLMISGLMFFLNFKVHITSIAVDVDSINRYQEVPTAILGLTAFANDTEDQDFGPDKPDLRNKEKINCFNGNGIAGSHEPNADLCTKHLAFYFSKISSEKGDVLFSNPEEVDTQSGLLIAGVPFDLEEILWPEKTYPQLYVVKNNIRASLPTWCYKIGIEVDGAEIDKLDPYSDLPNRNMKPSGGKSVRETVTDLQKKFEASCNTNSPKLDESYPMPIIFGGVPFIAEQRLLIYSSSNEGEDYFVTWPKYTMTFDFGGG